MYYNARLEKSFLMDEFAKPPTVPSFTFIGDTTSMKRAVVPSVQSTPVAEREYKSRMIGGNEHFDVEREPKSESENVRVESVRKFEVEEKRISAKSVVDFDDPLRLKASADNDEVFASKTAEPTSDLSFTEVPLKENNFRTALQDTVLSYSPFIEVRIIV